MITAEKLKIQVKTKAHKNNLQPQDIMQMDYFIVFLLVSINIILFLKMVYYYHQYLVMSEKQQIKKFLRFIHERLPA